MLNTKLKHLQTAEETAQALKDHECVMICCGRMGPMCIPVYRVMERLEARYPQVTFRDMDFDIPAADYIKGLPECSSFMGLPFTVYFKKGKVVDATPSIQSEKDIVSRLDRHFTP